MDTRINSPLIESQKTKTYRIEEITAYKGIYNCYIKRIIGFMLAVFMFITLLPVYIIISLAIIIDTGRPVFYRANRGGYRGQSFKIYKFRSMIANADKIGGGTTALEDNRVTRVGNFLRKTKLDETAQLINIIKGEMCFVGPRPELLQYTSQYKGAEECILQVRPGITDYSSLEFINLDELVGGKDADEIYEKYILGHKNNLRIKYAATVSFKTDIKLFFATIVKVFEKAFRVIFKNRG